MKIFFNVDSAEWFELDLDKRSKSRQVLCGEKVVIENGRFSREKTTIRAFVSGGIANKRLHACDITRGTLLKMKEVGNDEDGLIYRVSRFGKTKTKPVNITLKSLTKGQELGHYLGFHYLARFS